MKICSNRKLPPRWPSHMRRMDLLRRVLIGDRLALWVESHHESPHKIAPRKTDENIWRTVLGLALRNASSFKTTTATGHKNRPMGLSSVVAKRVAFPRNYAQYSVRFFTMFMQGVTRDQRLVFPAVSLALISEARRIESSEIKHPKLEAQASQFKSLQ